jgi:hypothetical protein
LWQSGVEPPHYKKARPARYSVRQQESSLAFSIHNNPDTAIRSGIFCQTRKA